MKSNFNRDQEYRSSMWWITFGALVYYSVATAANDFNTSQKTCPLSEDLEMYWLSLGGTREEPGDYRLPLVKSLVQMDRFPIANRHLVKPSEWL